ncbi:hypothetical protein D9611_000873 [Ephemerocybe angulata]|uniref:Bromodomain associated domain-containing protein n=1 Tax=Ephemerocybe angulata TaxID=980116 RepID=A0A8H5F765_9AGAR|nr:hypothetical protein D9611_000873 [Tulosesus angulatus]
MDPCAQKLLESATHKTLHAHAFSRASSQATAVLTDLLSRYLQLLSGTCAAYAGHAGRSTLTVYDALAALEELGAGLEDLKDYGEGEGRELGRYALHSARRQEELNDFRGQIMEGMKQDKDDAIPLEYARFDGPIEESEDEESGESEDEGLGLDADAEGEVIGEDDSMDVDSPLKRHHGFMGPPPLPLSPVSNSPPSPSRKRPRTANWSPPEYVPDFLPPFPSISTATDPGTMPASGLDSLRPSPLTQTFDLPSTSAAGAAAEENRAVAAALQVPQTLTTTTSTSDILVQVPYSQSTLSGLPERHLPGPPPPPSNTSSRPMIVAPRQSIPQVESSFIAAYHYILTHPPPTTPPPSTLQRHRVAMSLLSLIQSSSRWTPSDSLYGSIAPCPPRVATVPPSYPVAVTDLGAGQQVKDGAGNGFKFPGSNNRPVATVDRLAPLVAQPSSRLPDLARSVLHPAILARSTRLVHPPVLHRGSKPLVYGPGVPAPWNSNPIPPTDANGVPQTPLTTKAKDSLNGKGDDGESNKPAIPDALLFATWDYDSKDYRVPLPRHRTRMGSVASGSGSGATITLPQLRKSSLK